MPSLIEEVGIVDQQGRAPGCHALDPARDIR
jgi:hypothetical protein